jgi:hypothetical protein
MQTIGIAAASLLLGIVFMAGCTERNAPTSPSVDAQLLQGQAPVRDQCPPGSIRMDFETVRLIKAQATRNNPFLVDEKGNGDEVVCAKRLGNYWAFTDNNLPSRPHP